ncbi:MULTISPECIES: YbaK/EbsC family protein [unclassified Clostridium]|uniref:YbaK/EbsC family protein n=1 Tax=unclassified Clostridium TaxID=2614128 RepID=UPI001105890D|nr:MULTISPECIES: YbaK/EbsC family protein [unclassified Clostridium]
MSIEAAREHLKKWGRDQDIIEFDASSATVPLAALAVGCEPGRIAKTLSFQAEEGCLLIVTAGDAKIDNAKYKARFGRKAKMLTPEQALAQTGHAVGGVCPFGVGAQVQVFLDISLKRFETVYPACGSGNSAICLTLPELETYSDSRGWVDVCKDWQEIS